MSHKFSKTPAYSVKNGFVFTCIKCGAERIRYKNGSYSYIVNGRVVNSGQKCESDKSSVGLVLPIQTPIRHEVEEIITKELNLKARFTELLVMLRCAADELPNGKIKGMCNRFLYSQDHKQIVKQIQG